MRPRRGESISELHTGVTIPFPSAAYLTSGALVVVAAATTALTFFVPGILRGTAVMNGSARGTALVLLVIAVPVVVLSMTYGAGGSVRAVIAWLGGLAYMVYNSVLFVFITPFNRLFLLYVAMLALSIWSVATVLHRIDLQALRSRFAATMPVRAIAGYLLVIMALNGGAWLMRIIPALFAGGSPEFLQGTGLTTNPIYVQDLGFWVPLMAVAGVWLWQRRAWGYLLVGVLLSFGVIEFLGVGVDQWFGHNADPTSPVASAVFLPVGVVLAAVSLVPLFVYYRSLDGGRRPSQST